LVQSNQKDKNLNWLLIGLSIMFLIISGAICYVLYFYNPVKLIESTENLSIGGLLILVAIGIGITPFRIFYNLYFTSDYFNLDNWSFLTLLDSNGYNPPLAILFVIEILRNCFDIAFFLLLNILFYKKRTSFPELIFWFYIIDFILSLIFEIGNGWFNPGYKLFDDISSFVKNAIGVAIWAPYFYYSKKVKQTFTIRLS
jgi:Protein of unknown function (DUF2569)